jgi:NAD(P)-dependent dehydrogenase (short-subunit alcohol dehydrogenase family)
VVSNAGYGLMGAAEELTDEQVRHQIDTTSSAQSNWTSGAHRSFL